eukprot:9509997-Alexandrium_andersonii.AAC.1
MARIVGVAVPDSGVVAPTTLSWIIASRSAAQYTPVVRRRSSSCPCNPCRRHSALPSRQPL